MLSDNVNSAAEFRATLTNAGIPVNPNEPGLGLRNWIPSFKIQTTRNVKYYDDHKKVNP